MLNNNRWTARQAHVVWTESSPFLSVEHDTRSFTVVTLALLEVAFKEADCVHTHTQTESLDL